ncbi:MAG: phosphate ABC transporter ATP-binding protein [Myxococcales bacterium]|nr:phosphate ABC transporter ATP-binding protein [Myxococcales bacterium]
MEVLRDRVTAIIGPSGCGKSTLVRCINRLHELTPGARVRGVVEVDGEDVYRAGVDPSAIRRRVGMIFSRPNLFPTMSVRDNVLAGLRLSQVKLEEGADAAVERALSEAALWAELRDQLDRRALTLAPGVQQRLCIARALALRPEVLLMDEPCSTLDPMATAQYEDVLEGIRGRYTIVIVTHNMQQAARVSQRTAFMLQGELIEIGDTDEIFTAPTDKRTEDYITGKFG